ncbi:hypothetical protein H9P43_003041 [Blastocladiella emersonii ATCC 22665]|nr:hypothetical protein H9P43_003041 [Blastocladiella emersonii ATCC 22665]
MPDDDASTSTVPRPVGPRARWTTVSRLVRTVAAFRSAAAAAAAVRSATDLPPPPARPMLLHATSAHPMLLPDDPADREFARWQERRAARAWLASALHDVGLDADAPVRSELALAARRHVDTTGGCAWTPNAAAPASLASVLVHLAVEPDGCRSACALHALPAIAPPPSTHELARIVEASGPVDALRALAEYYAHAAVTRSLPLVATRALSDVYAVLRDLAPPPPPYTATAVASDAAEDAALAS